MNPLSRKPLVKQTAEELDLPEKDVDSVVTTYYAYVQSIMNNVEHTHVLVPNLGTFVVKPWSLRRKIDRTKRYIDALQHPRSVEAYAARQSKIRDLEQLERAQTQIDTLEASRKAFKLNKKANNDEQAPTDMA